MSRDELARQSEGIDDPAALDDETIQTMGTTPDPEYDSSPDVAVDGSIATETADSTTASQSAASGGLWSIYATVRAFVRAPVGLLRRYLLPLVAFLLVFGAVVYLLL